MGVVAATLCRSGCRTQAEFVQNVKLASPGLLGTARPRRGQPALGAGYYRMVARRGGHTGRQ